MKRSLVAVCALLYGSSSFAERKPPHPIRVIPGVPMRAKDIKPYVPPRLDPEPPVEPTDVKTVEITAEEAVVHIRPWSSPMVGNAIRGARLPLRGVISQPGHGCSAKLWYAVEPFGYLCGRDAKPTTEPASTDSVLHVAAGERLPFHYVTLLVKEGDHVSMWTSVAQLKAGAEPERQLKRGDTVAVEKSFKWEGSSYWLSTEGKVIPQKGSAAMGSSSAWHGIELTDATPLPFGWVTAEKLSAYAAPPEKGQKETVAELTRRTRLQILDERAIGRKRWLRVAIVADGPPAAVTSATPPPPSAPSNGPTPPSATTPPAAVASPPPSELWVSAEAVNEVRKLPIPKTVPADVTQWIDVDLGEQVLTLYEGERPVFATLISSGRAIPTPMGTYPVWAKVSAITMKNQPYEDKEYFVNKVPWSTFFQWHNAIHGAYWHDRFGVTKSHGCVNVAPLDARHIFEWVKPPLPPGWTGLRPLDLIKSPTVVVRNSHMKNPFRQDRPIGPPDRALEASRLEEAEKRRAAEAPPSPQVESLAPGPPSAPLQ